jgi:hypothetical protein
LVDRKFSAVSRSFFEMESKNAAPNNTHVFQADCMLHRLVCCMRFRCSFPCPAKFPVFSHQMTVEMTYLQRHSNGTCAVHWTLHWRALLSASLRDYYARTPLHLAVGALQVLIHVHFAHPRSNARW